MAVIISVEDKLRERIKELTCLYRAVIKLPVFHNSGAKLHGNQEAFLYFWDW